MIAHRSAPSRKIMALVAILVLCLAASSSLAEAVGDNPPSGKLTAAEYRALLRSERLSNKSEKAKSIKKSKALWEAGCAALEAVHTPLLVAEHDACMGSMDFLSATSRTPQTDGCGSDESGDPTGCLADLIGAMATGAEKVILTFGVVNKEIARRSLPAVCARQISLTKRNLSDLKHFIRDARAMEAALRSGDKKAIARAGKRFDSSFYSDPSSGDSGSVKRCPHAAR
jgi:hypothetical protein